MGFLTAFPDTVVPLLGAVAVVIAQALVDKPNGVSMSYIPLLSRTGVVVMLALISAGAVSAVVSLARRERPGLLAVVGFASDALLMGLFWHFEFYALGFDQDTWAPR